MNQSKLAADLGTAVIMGMLKSAAVIPAPLPIRQGLARRAASGKWGSGISAGIGRHLVPVTSANVSDLATNIALGAGLTVASDRVARHVIKKMNEAEERKARAAAEKPSPPPQATPPSDAQEEQSPSQAS